MRCWQLGLRFSCSPKKLAVSEFGLINSQTQTRSYQTNLKELNMKKSTKVLLAIAAATVATSAFAGAGGNQFGNIYTELVGWLSGAPGKSIAVLAFGLAMFNVVKQNFIAAGGSFVGCLLMANAEGIIDGFLTAGI